MMTMTTTTTMVESTKMAAVIGDVDFSFPIDCVRADDDVISGTEWSQWHLFINVYLTCMVCLLGFIGNSLTVLVICRDKDKYNTTNWLLQTLAAADSLYLVTCLYTQPITILHKMWNETPRHGFDHRSTPTQHLANEASILTIHHPAHFSLSTFHPPPPSSLLPPPPLSPPIPSPLSLSPSSLPPRPDMEMPDMNVMTRHGHLLGVPRRSTGLTGRRGRHFSSPSDHPIKAGALEGHPALSDEGSISPPPPPPPVPPPPLPPQPPPPPSPPSPPSRSTSTGAETISIPHDESKNTPRHSNVDGRYYGVIDDMTGGGFSYDDFISPCLNAAAAEATSARDSPAESRKDLWTDVFMWPVASTAHTATIWAVVLLTSDRYLAVCHPFKSHLRTLARIRMVTLGLFVAAVAYNVPLVFERKLIWKAVAKGEAAAAEDGDGGSSGVTYVIVGSDKSSILKDPIYQLLYKTVASFIFKSIGPLVTLFTFNLLLLQKLRANRRRRGRMCHNNQQHQQHQQQHKNSQQYQMQPIHSQDSSQQFQQLQQHNRHQQQSHIESSTKHRENITIMLIIVVSVFIVCQLPDVFLRIVATQFTAQFHHTIRNYFLLSNSVANLLLALNSSINFFIYCLVGRKFRNILFSSLPVSCRRGVRSCRRCRSGAGGGATDDGTTRPETHRERMSKITLMAKLHSSPGTT